MWQTWTDARWRKDLPVDGTFAFVNRSGKSCKSHRCWTDTEVRQYTDRPQPENVNSREEDHGEIWTGFLSFIFLTFFCAHLFDSTKHTTIDIVLRPLKDVPWIDPPLRLSPPLTLPTPAFSLHSLSVMYTDSLLTGMLLLITMWWSSLYPGWYGPEGAYGWCVTVKGVGEALTAFVPTIHGTSFRDRVI